MPANFQIPTKLCTDLPNGMNKRFSVGDIFFYFGQNPGGPRPSDRGKILIIRQFKLFLPSFDVMRFYIDLCWHNKSFKSVINDLK